MEDIKENMKMELREVEGMMQGKFYTLTMEGKGEFSSGKK